MYKYPYDVQIWIHHIYICYYCTSYDGYYEYSINIIYIYIYKCLNDGQINHGISWEYNGNIRGVSLTSEISDIKMRRFVVLKNVYNGI